MFNKSWPLKAHICSPVSTVPDCCQKWPTSVCYLGREVGKKKLLQIFFLPWWPTFPSIIWSWKQLPLQLSLAETDFVVCVSVILIYNENLSCWSLSLQWQDPHHKHGRGRKIFCCRRWVLRAVISIVNPCAKWWRRWPRAGWFELVIRKG